MNKAKLPSFIIPGVAKSGTTSIYFYLNQHPEISIPKKETFYFISEILEDRNRNDPAVRKEESIISDIDTYRDLYNGTEGNKITGEVSTCYMYYYEHAAAKIKSHLGKETKILIVLRNPTDRALSCYKHFLRDNLESRSFFDALQEEDLKIKEKMDFMWYYKDLGFYYNAIKHYMSHFSNVKVMLYDDLQNDPISFMKSAFEFLDVDPNFVPETNLKYNSTGQLKSQMLQDIIVNESLFRKMLRPIARSIFSESLRYRIICYLKRKNTISESGSGADVYNREREFLHDVYKEDILKVQDLIKADLSMWST